METSYESFLKSIEAFMKKFDGFEKEFEEKMTKLRELEQRMQTINQLRVEDKNQGVVAVRDACECVMYSEYVEAEAKATALTKLVREMEIDKFPEPIRPKGIEITGYVDEIKAQLQRVTSVINEITKMIDGIEKNDYDFSRTEKITLKMKILEVESGLKTWKDYQERAANGIKELKSGTASYKERQRKGAFLKVGCAAMAGVGAGAIAGGAVAVKLAANNAAALVGSASVGGGLVVGGVYGERCVTSLSGEYDETAQEIDTLCGALSLLEAKQKELDNKCELNMDKIKEIEQLRYAVLS